jgi:hypothetical protein
MEACRVIAGYHQRAVIAIENPETRDPVNWMATNNPFTREVRRFERDRGNVLQFVSILTVDPDSPAVWHARVGFLEPVGEYADRFVPMATWTDGMQRMAREEIAELLKLPRQDVTVASGIRPKGTPTNLHGFVRLSQSEASWMRGVMDGSIERTVPLRFPEVI